MHGVHHLTSGNVFLRKDPSAVANMLFSERLLSNVVNFNMFWSTPNIPGYILHSVLSDRALYVCIQVQK